MASGQDYTAAGFAANPVAATPIIAQTQVAHALGIGGGKSLSAGQRNQNELNDRRNQINGYQGLDPYLLQIINGQTGLPESNDTATNLKRYGSVYNANQSSDANTKDAASYINQIYGNLDHLGQTAYNEMASQLGRAPTTNEWNQLYQAFQGPNGTVNGRAAVSQYAQQIQNDPTNPNSSLNPINPGYGDRIGKYSEPVTQQFQNILGRAPTQDELNHFGSLLASGQTDAYGLQNFLKQQPEYTNAQDTQFRNSLNDTLTNYDTTEFNREKGSVMSDYAARGMQPGNSPSLDYALTDLMGKIATNRSAYLANLSAAQYGNNKDVATAGYQTSLNQMYDQNQQNRQRQNQLSDYYTQRGNQGADYYTQMNDYMNFMNKNRSRGTNPLYGAAGGLIGAGVGGFATAGNPMAISTGYQVGQGAGNAFGYQNY